jgi:hypothetical protein
MIAQAGETCGHNAHDFLKDISMPNLPGLSVGLDELISLLDSLP